MSRYSASAVTRSRFTPSHPPNQRDSATPASEPNPSFRRAREPPALQGGGIVSSREAMFVPEKMRRRTSMTGSGRGHSPQT